MSDEFGLTSTLQSFLDKELEKIQNSHTHANAIFSLPIWENLLKHTQTELLNINNRFTCSDHQHIQTECLNYFFESLSTEFLKDEILTDIYYLQRLPYTSTEKYTNLISHITQQRMSADTTYRQSESDIKKNVKRQVEKFYSFLEDTNLLYAGSKYGIFSTNCDSNFSANNLCIHKNIIPFIVNAVEMHQNLGTEDGKMNTLLNHFHRVNTISVSTDMPLNYYLERFCACHELYDFTIQLHSFFNNKVNKVYPLAKLILLFYPCIIFPYISQRNASTENCFLAFNDLIQELIKINNGKNLSERITIPESTHAATFNNIIYHIISNQWLFLIITKLYNDLINSSYFYLFHNLPYSEEEKLQALKQYLSNSKIMKYNISLPKNLKEFDKNILEFQKNVLAALQENKTPTNNHYTNFLKFLHCLPSELSDEYNDFLLGITNSSTVINNQQFVTFSENDLALSIRKANNYFNNFNKKHNIISFYNDFTLAYSPAIVRSPSSSPFNVTISYNK